MAYLRSWLDYVVISNEKLCPANHKSWTPNHWSPNSVLLRLLQPQLEPDVFSVFAFSCASRLSSRRDISSTDHPALATKHSIFTAIRIGDSLLAKISLETPENLFDNVFRSSSI
jgi:hypothetical protein